jgi:hypothetical protein
MSLTQSLLGISLLAPLQCALWHGARLGHWPGSETPLPRPAARLGGAVLLAFAVLLSGIAADSLLMALVLPLAALSLVGMLYVPLVNAWPGVTLSLCAVCALAGAELLLLAWMQAP